MTAARGFARYLSGINADTEVPPLGLMPRRAPWRRPFIYSAADIDALLELARRTIASPLRAATYQTRAGGQDPRHRLHRRRAPRIQHQRQRDGPRHPHRPLHHPRIPRPAGRGWLPVKRTPTPPSTG
jgi:hypothetical protein